MKNVCLFELMLNYIMSQSTANGHVRTLPPLFGTLLEKKSG